MTTYVHYINETEVSYPNPADFRGVPNWQTHDALLRSRGFLPLQNDPEEREGFTAVPSRYELVNQTKTVTRSRCSPRRSRTWTSPRFSSPAGCKEVRAMSIRIGNNIVAGTGGGYGVKKLVDNAWETVGTGLDGYNALSLVIWDGVIKYKQKITQSQMNAINSGINLEKVAKYDRFADNSAWTPDAVAKLIEILNAGTYSSDRSADIDALDEMLTNR